MTTTTNMTTIMMMMAITNDDDDRDDDDAADDYDDDRDDDRDFSKVQIAPRKDKEDLSSLEKRFPHLCTGPRLARTASSA